MVVTVSMTRVLSIIGSFSVGFEEISGTISSVGFLFLFFLSLRVAATGISSTGFTSTGVGLTGIVSTLYRCDSKKAFISGTF